MCPACLVPVSPGACPADWAPLPQVVCLIISTAEHCQEMVRQLARALAAKLEPRELAAK